MYVKLKKVFEVIEVGSLLFEHVYCELLCKIFVTVLNKYDRKLIFKPNITLYA